MLKKLKQVSALLLVTALAACGGGGSSSAGGGSQPQAATPGSLSISTDVSLSALSVGTLVLTSTGSNQILFRSFSFSMGSYTESTFSMVGNFVLPNITALTGSPLSNASGTLFQVSQSTSTSTFRVFDLNLPLISVLPWATSNDWRNFWLSVSVNGLNAVGSGGTRKLLCTTNNTFINLTATPINVRPFIEACTRA
jgi:hypothetical protein